LLEYFHSPMNNHSAHQRISDTIVAATLGMIVLPQPPLKDDISSWCPFLWRLLSYCYCIDYYHAQSSCSVWSWIKVTEC
jgi:hypothetical protein